MRVTDFGADPSGVADSARAVHEAILHARGLAGAVTIEFPHGRYTMFPEDAPKRELYVSNTVGRFEEFKVKNIGILLEDMHEVIVEGNGSELTFHGRATQFAVIRSTDVTIRNFSTDWHAPLVVDLTVLASGVEAGFGFRDIKVPSGVGYAINGATATFTGETSSATGEPYWSHGPEVATEWQNQIRDLASGLTLRSPLPLWTDSRSVSERGNNVLRISYDFPEDPGDAGKVYELRQRPRDTPGGLIWESERVELKDLALHYLHGFGIVGQLSRDLSLDGISLRAMPGSWRQTAGLADFIQLSGVAGKAQITNCLFDNPHDDPINIHGTYVQVEAIDRANRTVTPKYMERDTAGFPQFYPGDELRFVKRATLLSDGAEDYTVVAVTGPNGMDTSHDLERMTGIYISADADYWYESSGVTNATIRNNVFDRPASGWAAIWFDPTNAASEPARTVHSNISIDANRFMLLPGGSLVQGKFVAGLSFTNNHVGHYAPTAETPADCAGALFDFSASHGLAFSGNHYAPGFNAAVAISEMPAGEVDGAADGVESRIVNVTADVGRPAITGTPAGHDGGTLLAPLLDPAWAGVDFGAPASPLAWLTHAPAGTTQVSVVLAAAEPGTSLHIDYNDRKVSTSADGAYVLELLAGPNILEVRTLEADRRAGQTYRWVIIAA
ncbi:MAG: hypothetical protein WBX27_14195 [Specibacter sp.]